MTEYALPPLHVSADNTLVVGYASGSFMAAQLLLAFPDVFSGAGLLNGGAPGASQRLVSDYQPMFHLKGEEFKQAQAKQLQLTKDFISKGQTGDTTKLKGKPVYVWGGEKDMLVPDVMAKEQEAIFKDYGAEVKAVYNANYAHWFKEWTVAADVSDYAYTTLGVPGKDGGKWASDTAYIPNWLPGPGTPVPDSRKTGVQAKWDQEKFFNEAVKAADGATFETSGLRKWGSYYYPAACLTEQCKFQLVLHGCD